MKQTAVEVKYFNYQPDFKKALEVLTDEVNTQSQLLGE
jgi:hypothetical protein